MIQPKRIGRFLTTDLNGYIKSDVSMSYIVPPWLPVVEYVRDSLLQIKEITSIYIRGSIPRGLAIENISDVDFIFVAENSVEEEIKTLKTEVLQRFPFVDHLELLHLNQKQLHHIQPNKKRPYFHMFLKTQALFLAGDDFVKDILPFQIDGEMVSHIFSLEREFSKLAGWLEEDKKQGKEHVTCKWFSKRVVRSGLELTMKRSQRFTRNLYLCYEDFAEYYPQHKTDMYRVLINSLNGNEDPHQYKNVIQFLIDNSKNPNFF